MLSPKQKYYHQKIYIQKSNTFKQLKYLENIKYPQIVIAKNTNLLIKQVINLKTKLNKTFVCINDKKNTNSTQN